MGIKLITAPTDTPISLVEARAQCTIDADITAFDVMLQLYIAASVKTCEHRTGRKLMPQTWELALDAFPFNEIELPFAPVKEIVSVKYLDSDGIEQTIGNVNYSLDNYSLKNWLLPGYEFDWPETLNAANAVKIQFIAGYDSAALVPDNLKLWLLLAVATYFKNRESVITGTIVDELPRNFCEALLDAEWIPSF